MTPIKSVTCIQYILAVISIITEDYYNKDTFYGFQWHKKTHVLVNVLLGKNVCAHIYVYYKFY